MLTNICSFSRIAIGHHLGLPTELLLKALCWLPANKYGNESHRGLHRALCKVVGLFFNGHKEIAYWLRALVALAKDLSSIPSVHMVALGITTICNSNSWGLIFFSGLWRHWLHIVHRQKLIHLNKKQINIFKVNRHRALPIIGLVLIQRNLVLKMLVLSVLLWSWYFLSLLNSACTR